MLNHSKSFKPLLTGARKQIRVEFVPSPSSAFPHSLGNGPYRGNQRMTLPNKIVTEAIETAPLNRGLKGADWLASPGNIFVVTDDEDVTLFDNEGDGVFAIHVLYKSRGRKAIERAKDAIAELFEKHDARLIYGMAPVIRPEVRMLARWTGMRSSGLRETRHGLCELFVLSKFQWKVARS